MFLLAGLASIAIGLILMTGGGSEDPQVFNPEIFNTRRITIAPLFILLGFALQIIAIMSRPRN